MSGNNSNDIHNNVVKYNFFLIPILEGGEGLAVCNNYESKQIKLSYKDENKIFGLNFTNNMVTLHHAFDVTF